MNPSVLNVLKALSSRLRLHWHQSSSMVEPGGVVLLSMPLQSMALVSGELGMTWAYELPLTPCGLSVYDIYKLSSVYSISCTSNTR